jgi:hypothetical protein
MKKKILIIVGTLLLLIIVSITTYSFSKSSTPIGKITKCDTDNGVMYSIDTNAYDVGGLIILNGNSIYCNWAWGGPSEECQNLPKTNSCKTIYASPSNIYGEPVKVTIEGLFTLMKYK